MKLTRDSYGEFALSQIYTAPVEDWPGPGKTYQTNLTDVFYGSDYWTYRFLEGPASSSNNWPITAQLPQVYTDRSINSTYSCAYYSVDPKSGNGLTTNIGVFFKGNTANSTIVNVPSVSPNETTFWVDNSTCGPRCAAIQVFQASDTTPTFYNCNISITGVGNAKLPEHQINDTFAKIAARSIALGVATDKGVYYQKYPQEAYYGNLFVNDPDSIGLRMAFFAIGALGIAYLSNPTITSIGVTPEPGLSINIHSNTRLILIFVLISGVQLLCLIVTTFIASNVIVIDNSPVAISRLLHPIMNRLGSGGTTLSAKEICQVLHKEDTEVLGRKDGEAGLIYTARRYDAEGRRARLVLGDGTREGAFKSGHYD
jgi:hypothetical protein